MLPWVNHLQGIVLSGLNDNVSSFFFTFQTYCPFVKCKVSPHLNHLKHFAQWELTFVAFVCQMTQFWIMVACLCKLNWKKEVQKNKNVCVKADCVIR